MEHPRRDAELTIGGVLATTAAFAVGWILLVVPNMGRYWLDALILATAIFFSAA